MGMCCEHPSQPTLNSKGEGGPGSAGLSPRTYNDYSIPGVGNIDQTKYNPWRAPGHAPVADPCGIAGGWGTPGAPGNGGVPPPGFTQGDRGSNLPPSPTSTKWRAGKTATAMWGVVANHGGGKWQHRVLFAEQPRLLTVRSLFCRLPVPPVPEVAQPH